MKELKFLLKQLID